MWNSRSKTIVLLAVLLASVAAIVAAVMVLFVVDDSNRRSSYALNELRGTMAPTVSVAPSAVPSSPPSISLQPSAMPSAFPSMTASMAPTSLPSLAPTSAPSATPSVEPTPQPTIVPPIPSDFDFVLKMHWQRSYFWQETHREFKWCAECTKCSRLTDTDDGDDFCRDKDRNDPKCKDKDQFWIQNCGGARRGNAVFNVLQYANFDMLRIKSTNLCMTRVNERYVRLERCSARNKHQKWEKIRLDKPFDLRDIDPSNHRCLTQAVSIYFQAIGSITTGCSIDLLTH